MTQYGQSTENKAMKSRGYEFDTFGFSFKNSMTPSSRAQLSVSHPINTNRFFKGHCKKKQAVTVFFPYYTRKISLYTVLNAWIR